MLLTATFITFEARSHSKYKKSMRKKKILLLILNLISLLLNRYTITDNIIQDELPLVVVMPSYNNAERYTLTLDSVFSQKYENFRVVYIDDASPDDTDDLVEQYIKEHGLEYKCLYYDSLATFEDSWNKTTVDLNKVGLFFEHSKIILA